MKQTLLLALLILTSKLFAVEYGHAVQTKLTIKDGLIYIDGIKVKGLSEGEVLTAKSTYSVKVDGETFDLRSVVRNEIIEQTSYLYGVLQSEPLAQKLRLNSGLGIMGESQTIKDITVSKIEGSRIYFSYKLQTGALINKAFLGEESERELATLLPATTKEEIIYNKSCTDSHYETFDDYWYFFDPIKPTCEKFLKGAGRSVKVTLEFSLSKDEKEITFPEYDELYRDNTVKAFLFFGYDESVDFPDTLTLSEYKKLIEESKPNLQSDVAYDSFVDMISTLKKEGFKLVSKKEWFSLGNFSLEHDGELPGVSNLVTLEKNIGGKRVQIDLLLTQTGIDSMEYTFANYYKTAVENYELISYSGHSGLGANLDIKNINMNLKGVGLSKINFKKMPYQIFYFNGCSTYAYFNRDYFKAKGGTKGMESITTGLPSLFANNVASTMAFLDSFINFKRDDYSVIVNKIEDSNYTGGPTLIYVNGDQDNPKLSK